MKKNMKESSIINEESSNLIRGISISTFLNNFGLIVYFIAREILLYNMLNKADASNFTVFLGLMDVFVSLVIITPAVLPKIFPEMNKNKINIINKTVLFILVLNYFLISSIIFILTIFGVEFNLTLNLNDIYLFLILSIGFIGESIKNTIASIFYGLKKPKEPAILKVIFAFLFIILMFFFKLIKMLNFDTIVLTFILSDVIYIIISIFFYRKISLDLNIQNNAESFNSEITKRILLFSYPLCLTRIFVLLSSKVGTVVLAGISMNYSVYYHLSTSLVIFIIGFIGYPIQSNVQTYLSEFYENGNISQVRNTYHLIITIIIFFLIPILIILYGLIPLVIKILYNNYYNTEFITLFKIVILGGSFYSLNVLFNRIIIAKGKPKVILISQFFSGMISIFFIGISLFTRNLIYTGIGFITSNIVMFVIFCYYSKKYTNLTIKEMKFFPIIFIFYISIFIYELVYLIIKNMYISTIISILIFFLLIIILRVGSIATVKNILNIINPLKKPKSYKN